jgi:sulfoxide reductase heme-binding subunit YedZ
MSEMNLPHHNDSNESKASSTRTLSLILVILGGIAVGVRASILLNPALGPVLGSTLNQIFAVDSVQVMWYITRAAGLTAYMLLWFSTAWGLAVSSKILDTFLHRSFTYDFHQFISLLAVGFILLHIIVLMADRYLPYSLTQVLVPFLSPYRPLWVGIGVLGFYLTLLVTITFYIRGRIGVKSFRVIHYLSLIGYLFATVHGFFAGTDTPLPATELMYAGTFLVVVFLTSYWLIVLAQKKLGGFGKRVFGEGGD